MAFVIDLLWSIMQNKTNTWKVAPKWQIDVFLRFYENYTLLKFFKR